ncbi:TorF family putative porin [Duganella vulcania]|uniref:Choline dehydrogenase n=1 Tax=Duganella vulcania TaxID=2692166 RepID=A0A845GL06_9BURK|nr:TorF family putative porin [Duganella vulcania]MYM94671.1 choline dehydrogenase [Duganella vulcania]
MKYAFWVSIASTLALAASAPVSAQTAADPVPASSPVTANVTLASQYISRGFRQTWGKPALQGGFDYTGPGGFSAGTWLSNVSNRFVENGTLEWDLYGAYGGAAGDVGYSAGVYYYKYPGAEIHATHTTYDYAELALGLTYKAAYAKYNYTVTKEFFGIENARGTGYLDLGANVDLGEGYTLNLHFGHGRVANNSMWSWRDYKAGVTKVLAPGWAVSAAYTKAHGKTGAYDNYTLGIPNSAGVIETSNPADGTLVLALTRTF